MGKGQKRNKIVSFVMAIACMLCISGVMAYNDYITAYAAGTIYAYSRNNVGDFGATGTGAGGGCGDVFEFTPPRSGIYRFYSTKGSGDPYIVISDRAIYDDGNADDYNGANATYSWNLTDAPTYVKIKSLTKYSYEGTDNVGYNDDGNGDLNFNIFVYMEKGHVYDVYATRWSTGSQATFNTHCVFMGTGNITLNNQGATTSGTTNLYGGRAGYNACVSKNRGFKYTTGSNGNGNVTNKITIPTKTGYRFNGYYTGTNGSGSQVINANGKIDSRVLSNTFASNGTIYAYWTPMKQNYALYNGDTKVGTVSAMYGSTLPTLSTAYIPTKTGYTFTGYYNGASLLYNPNGTSSYVNYYADGTTKLDAHWTPNTYKINFNANGGTGSCIANATYDAVVSDGLVPIPAKTGYDFEGYYSSDNVKYFGLNSEQNLEYLLDGKNWKKANDVTLTARWTPKKYDVLLYSSDDTYGILVDQELNERSSGYVTTIEDSPYGELELPSAEDLGLVKTHYDFVGWNIYDGQNWAMFLPKTIYRTGLTTDGNVYDGAGNKTESHTVQIYAAWAPKDSFTITYNANGGKGAPRNATTFEGESYSIQNTVPTYDNYGFIGWYESPNGDNENDVHYYVYKESGELKPYESNDLTKCKISNISESKTLYARWVKNNSVTYNANGGSFSSALDITYPAKGDIVDVIVEPGQMPTRTGYVFKGWSTSPEVSVPQYTVDSHTFVMGDAPVVLYAVWEIEHYTISYNPVIVDDNVRNTTEIQDNSITIARITDYNTNVDYSGSYSFKLIYDNRVCDSNNLQVNVNNVNIAYTSTSTEGNQVTNIYTVSNVMTNQVVLINGLTQKLYNITYVKNGGNYAENADIVTEYYFNESGAVELPDMTRNGYTFAGWYTDSALTNVCNTDSDKYVIAKNSVANYTLYAKWTPITYTVNYNSNLTALDGITGSVPTNATVNYDANYNVSNRGDMKLSINGVNINFLGWNTNRGAVSAEYTEGETVRNLSAIANETITLYAIWDLEQFRVSYDLDGGEADIESETVYSGTNYQITNTEPIKAGHTFKSWEINNQSYTVNSDNIIEVVKDNIVLKAVWEPNKYNIKYVIDPMYSGNKLANSNATVSANAVKVNDNPATSQETKSVNNVSYGEAIEIEGYTDKVTVTKVKDNPEDSDTELKMHFLGWSTDQDDTTAIYKAGDKVTNLNISHNVDNNGIITLYAIFGMEPSETRYLIYDIKDGAWTDGSVPKPTKITGAPVSVTSNIPKKTGYTFKGWSYTDPSTNVDIQAGETMSSLPTGSANIVLQAVFEPDNYTIVFDPNDNYVAGISSTPTTEGAPSREGDKGVYIPETIDGVTYRRIGPAYSINEVATSKGLMDDQSATYGTSVNLAANKYMSDTYKFLGWSYKNDAASPEFTDGENVKNLKYDGSGNTILYAVWEPKAPLVRFNANGGDGGPLPVYESSENYNSADNKVSIPTMLPIRDGYKFLGWSTKADDTLPEYSLNISYEEVTGAEIRSFNKDLTITDSNKSVLLYAVWEKLVTYNIEYVADGNASVPVDINNYYLGDEIDVDIANAPVNAGYHFVAWKDKANNTYDAEKASFNVTDVLAEGSDYNKVIKLTEQLAPNTYKVNFYYNGNQLNGEAISLTYDQDIDENTTAKNTIDTIENSDGIKSEAGFTFIGWSMIEGSTDPVVLKNLTTVNGAEISLYAIRIPTKVNINVNNDNGTDTFVIENVKAEYGKIMPAITVTIPEKYGYTFDGYYTKQDGQGNQLYDEVLNARMISEYSSDITMYAKWKKKEYRIIYIQEGNVLKTDTIAYGESAKMAGSSICLDGTVVKGDTKLREWSTTGKLYKENDNEIEPKLYDPGQTYLGEKLWNDGGDLILYPCIGKDETYTVTYNTNGGAGGPIDVKTYEDGDLAIINTSTKPERDNYDFLGWSTDSGATQPEYVVNESCSKKMNSNVTLYAIWKIGTYTIHYESNAQNAVLKDGQDNTLQVEKGASILTHKGDIYEREGYDLLGWSTSNSLKNSVTYSLNGAINSALTSSDAITLYTVWAPKSYLVSFETNAEEIIVDDMLVTYDASYGSLPVISRTGYTFAGWYDNPELTGDKVLAKDKYTLEGNQILYAKWSEDTYSITYYSNVEATDASKMTEVVKVNDNVILKDKDSFEALDIVKPGYTLIGFATTRNGAAIYELGQNTGVEWAAKGSNVKLYCVWEANTYKINFDSRGGDAVESRDYTYGSKYGSLPVPERKGYTFKGWYKDYNETENSYSNMITSFTVVDVTNETTLYAVWDEESLEVIYYPNYDNKQGISVTYSLASDVILKDASFFEVRPGYSLEGYATTSRGAIVFDQGQSVGDTFLVSGSSIKLYMVWSANDYIVSFDSLEEANGTFAPITVTYGDTYGALPIPKREGYLFEGWYSSYNKETNEFDGLITEDSVVKITENQVLYSKMTAYYVVKQKRVVFQEAAKTKADGKKYKIIISNKKLASMNKKGVIKFKKPGIVKITVIKADKVLEYVIDIKLPIIPKKLAMNVGDMKALDIQGVDGLKITYTSTNPAVATVDESGNVTAVSKGKAKIVASINGKEYKTKIRVR